MEEGKTSLTWEDLPVELMKAILRGGSTEVEDERYQDFSSSYICRFVCKKWRDMLPPPPPPTVSAPPDDEEPTDRQQKCVNKTLRTFLYDLGFEGHFKLLKWAKKNGCPLLNSFCGGAARGGNLNILQWAEKKGISLEDGLDYNNSCCAEAAEGGHLEVKKKQRTRNKNYTLYNRNKGK